MRTDCRSAHRERLQEEYNPSIVFLGFAVLFTAPVLGIFLGHISAELTVSYWQHAPITSLNALEEGGTFKVLGVASDGDGVVLGGQEYSSRSRNGLVSWHWVWNDTDEFLLEDSTGQITVTSRRWWMVEDAPHYATNADHAFGTEYLTGDSIYVLGTVHTDTDGTRKLEALIVSPAEERPAPSSSALPAMAFGMGGVIVAWIAMLEVFRRRKAQSERSHDGREARPVEWEQPFDPSLPWRSNHWMGDQFGLAMLGLTLLLAALLSWTAVVDPAHGRESLIVVEMFGTMTPAFGLVVVLDRVANPPPPKFVALGRDGVHFWFASPQDRYAQVSFVAWPEIVEIRRARGKQRPWTLYRAPGTSIRLRLSLGNLRRLRDSVKVRSR